LVSNVGAGVAVLFCNFGELIAQLHLDWSAQSVLQLRLERSIPGERLEILRQGSVKPSELLTLSQFSETIWKIYAWLNN
jgi:hypothetical protein